MLKIIYYYGVYEILAMNARRKRVGIHKQDTSFLRLLF